MSFADSFCACVRRREEEEPMGERRSCKSVALGAGQVQLGQSCSGLRPRGAMVAPMAMVASRVQKTTAAVESASQSALQVLRMGLGG